MLAASSCSPTVVGFDTPFHRATVNALKPVPVIVSVSGVPARPLVGERAVMVGSGFSIGTRLPIRFEELDPRHGRALSENNSPSRSPVFRSPAYASRIVVTLCAGDAACLRNRPAPATCGVAIEVPLNTAERAARDTTN